MTDQEPDTLTMIPKWATSWEPRAKLIAAVFYIFTVISFTNLSVIFIAFAIAFAGLVLMKISLILLLKRYLIITPFLLLMTVPLLFNFDLSFHTQNAVFILFIIMKAFISMTVITIILDSQSIDQFINSLAGLKIPAVFITVLILSYRYVFLFLEDIQKMQTAAKSRFFCGGIGIKKVKVYGELTAALLSRSMERADRMYEAMVSRCFTGKLHFQKGPQIMPADIAKTGCTIIMILLLLFADKQLPDYLTVQHW
ncbi:cobalt ECF transporter T component CbiQ [Virgibacillus sp. YIM 98842]|jgi:cobalt/nickel transport system permease protein|uniref:cobalt ECF transporter T component CbiQ n=1 Tax=Virgibacillus sp. YIM 98842 TaxID=2663533 RepID=UPI0013DB619F|nr:cobalt ECF transporter T component CbiQ [Virgibacillus sp. YIM 98842]